LKKTRVEKASVVMWSTIIGRVLHLVDFNWPNLINRN
jgi:hypothetical protein